MARELCVSTALQLPVSIFIIEGPRNHKKRVSLTKSHNIRGLQSQKAHPLNQPL